VKLITFGLFPNGALLDELFQFKPKQLIEVVNAPGSEARFYLGTINNLRIMQCSRACENRMDSDVTRHPSNTDALKIKALIEDSSGLYEWQLQESLASFEFQGKILSQPLLIVSPRRGATTRTSANRFPDSWGQRHLADVPRAPGVDKSRPPLGAINSRS
jgi:hypothetical protein